MIGVNLSAGFYLVSFQPILVNVFRASDAKLGIVYEVVAFLAVIPPLLVAYLSRILMDRNIMVLGLGIKLVGMALFLPLLGRVHEWQVVLGFLLIIKASIFFSTASISLFTKLLGPMSSSMLLGVLSSVSNVGPAFAQILLSSHIVRYFGGYVFGLFMVPAALSMLLILYPWYWKRLDPNREFTRLVLEQSGRV